MAKETQGLPEDRVIKLSAIETDPHSQDVILCENMPVICIRKLESIGVDNGERLTIFKIASDSDILLRLDDDEGAEPIRVPPDLFQKHFYVAYAITYFQSQGCTITGRYTIWDWDFHHVDWRAKNVAMSRATSKANVGILPEGS
eukprot:2595518-Prymnesium_polylepis.3